MLPVSGGLQLKTSADQMTRPMISHSGAYSRLESPAPRWLSGRNRFHRPSAFAFFLSSSTVGESSKPWLVSSSTRASLG